MGAVKGLLDVQRLHIWENNRQQLYAILEVQLHQGESTERCVQEIIAILKGFHIENAFVHVNHQRSQGRIL
jgi:Co/Zn/Cd efflux system component